jgi:hypothetical protein
MIVLVWSTVTRCDVANYKVQMRTNMDPLTPATSTLAPAISHIAETTAALSTQLSEHVPPQKTPDSGRKEKEKQTVKWVLDAPRRLTQSNQEGRRSDAEKDWDTIRALLDKWKDVSGVQEVRAACEKAMEVVEVEQ